MTGTSEKRRTDMRNAGFKNIESREVPEEDSFRGGNHRRKIEQRGGDQFFFKVPVGTILEKG
jgi:hypothetical protein